MKAVPTADVLLAYSNNSLPFYIETDASDHLMGVFIKQNNQPVAFWSEELSSA